MRLKLPRKRTKLSQAKRQFAQNKLNIQLSRGTTMKAKSVIFCAGLALILVFTPAPSRAEIPHDAGALFTMDNASAGNHVLAYRRAADGSLSPLGAFATGGIGTGGGL